METFLERVEMQIHSIKSKPQPIESWFLNTIPIDKNNGIGKHSGDSREKNNASIKELF